MRKASCEFDGAEEIHGRFTKSKVRGNKNVLRSVKRR